MPEYRLNWSIVERHLPDFIAGAWIDLWLAIIAFLFAVIGGFIVAILRLGAPWPIAGLAFLYVQLARGVPMYVLLFWVYFGLAAAVAIPFTAIQAALIALTLAGCGYTAEVFRAGIQAVDRGHAEAGRALGMSGWRIYGDIVMPQAIRYIIPPLAGVFVVMLKWATLVSVIAVTDMIFLARQINVQEFAPFEAFSAVGAIFVVLVGAVSLGVTALERYFRLPR
jgi:His/Glu/Gln/Arg/opine family amino acid ABC transporter permease subunit